MSLRHPFARTRSTAIAIKAIWRFALQRITEEQFYDRLDVAARLLGKGPVKRPVSQQPPAERDDAQV